MKGLASKQQSLVSLLKAAISLFLLYLSLRTVDMTSVRQPLNEIDPFWIGFMVFLLCAQVPMLALRWHEIARASGGDLAVDSALRFTFVGLFFSQVLPSTAGGDAVRMWLMARHGSGWALAIYTVLIDRVVGISAMAVLVILCLPWTFQLVHDFAAKLALILLGFGTLGAAAAFLGLGFIQLPLIERWRLGRHLTTASRLAWGLCLTWAGVRVAALSFATHLITVTIMWAAAHALHDQVDFAYVLFVVLPVLLVATVPVSIAGWGIREGAMVLAFGYVGLSRSDGLMVSILYGLAALAVSTVGGVIWIAGGYRKPRGS